MSDESTAQAPPYVEAAPNAETPPLPPSLPESGFAEPPQIGFAPAWKPRPLWGPSLWTYGVVLWSYTVLGQFTTEPAPWSSRRVPLGGGTAALLFVACSALALWRSVHASAAFPSRFRNGARTLIAFGITLALWVITLLFASGLGSGSGSDVALRLLLIAIAIAALVFGRKLSRAPGFKLVGAERALVIVLWVGALLASVPAVLG